jgi:putative ABC transport system permease protein
MFDSDKWREIFQVLGKNLFRTTATAFGVFWGIFMLLVILGAGKGLNNGVMADFGDSATNSMFLWSQSTTMPYMGFKQGRNFDIRNSDVEYLEKNIPEIEILSPRNQLGGYRGNNNVIRGTKTGAFSVYGDYPQYMEISPLKIEKGRFLNKMDILEKRKICVIGSRVYEELFAEGEDAISKYVQINGVNFSVVGIYKSPFKGERGIEESKAIYIPFTTFQKAFNFGEAVGWLSITSKNGIPVSTIESKIVDALQMRLKIHPDDERAFGHYNVEEEFNQMNSVFLGINLLAWFVGILTLIAGIIGVSNIMLVIIKERTSELGVRRAIGATPSKIMGQIILESVFLTSIAGILGIIAGVWSLEGIDALLSGGEETGSFRNPGVDFSIVIVAFLVLLVSGVLAGILPSIKAVAMKPIDALRAE